MNQYKHLFLAMFFIFGLAGCTKELSEDIEIQVAPGQPRVFAIDTSIDAFGKAKDIKAPWFAARITVTNNNASESGNAKTAVITGITYYVTKPDGTAGTDGGFVAKDITGAASIEITTLNADKASYTFPVDFYFGALSSDFNPREDKNFNYKIELHIVGYFSDKSGTDAINNETDRLDAITVFTTQ